MPGTWSKAFGDMVRQVALFLPKALAFVAILAVGFIAAALVAKLVCKVLARMGFDRAVERGGVATALAKSGYDASDIVAKIVQFAVSLFALQLAFGIWGPNPVSALIRSTVAWLPNLLVAVLILVVAAALARAAKDLIGNALGGLSYGEMLGRIASMFIMGLAVFAALGQVGVGTTVLIPVLISVLATMAGVTIVGVGGGLIKPMQSRWEHWLNRAEVEASKVADQTRAYQAGQQAAAHHLTSTYAEGAAATTAETKVVTTPY